LIFPYVTKITLINIIIRRPIALISHDKSYQISTLLKRSSYLISFSLPSWIQKIAHPDVLRSLPTHPVCHPLSCLDFSLDFPVPSQIRRSLSSLPTHAAHPTHVVALDSRHRLRRYSTSRWSRPSHWSRPYLRPWLDAAILFSYASAAPFLSDLGCPPVLSPNGRDFHPLLVSQCEGLARRPHLVQGGPFATSCTASIGRVAVVADQSSDFVRSVLLWFHISDQSRRQRGP
jgi:hypothetical protein